MNYIGLVFGIALGVLLGNILADVFKMWRWNRKSQIVLEAIRERSYESLDQDIGKELDKSSHH